MDLRNHLLYIDITNICRLGCDFCMYQRERTDEPSRLVLNTKGRENLDNLINDPNTAHIIISGQGEPFNNEETLKEILKLSRGGRYFQIITNGNWGDTDIWERLCEFNQIAQFFQDRYSIRISIDSYHADKLGSHAYSRFLEVASRMENKTPNISLAIRSLVEDKHFVRSLIMKLLDEMNITYEITQDSELDDELVVGSSDVNITYKNLINPSAIGRDDAFPMFEYMLALERKYGKYFTFGNLAAWEAEKGLDLTISPDGDVYFYGIEIESFGNIFYDDLGMDYFAKLVAENKLLHSLYTIPFKEVLSKLSEYPEVEAEIQAINNPYWIIKSLFPAYKNEVETVLELE